MTVTLEITINENREWKIRDPETGKLYSAGHFDNLDDEAIFDGGDMDPELVIMLVEAAINDELTETGTGNR